MNLVNRRAGQGRFVNRLRLLELLANPYFAMSESDGFSFSDLLTRSQRMLRLAGMTATVAANYAHSRLRRALSSQPPDAAELTDLYQTIGEEIAHTLGQLKGAAMKAGQFASQLRELLPTPLAQALEPLQKAVPPAPFKVIRRQFRAELKIAPEQAFAWFDAQPFAAASIGQAHRARTRDGREVVVKVQYPGVARACDADLAQLKLLLRLGGLFNLDRAALDRLFEEVRARLREELDYRREAANIRRFREFHRADEGVVIPEVVAEFSGKRILTLRYEPGDDLSEVKPPRYDPTVVDALGIRLFRTLARQLFLLQAVHADPHPGNFAFRPDGALVLYDFGCVKRLDRKTIQSYRELVRAFLQADYPALDRALLALGVRIEGSPPVEADYYAEWREILIPPFRADKPFDFADSTLHENVMRQAPGMLQRLDSFQPAAELVYINRVIGGHYWNLLRLGVRASFRTELEQLLAEEKG